MQASGSADCTMHDQDCGGCQDSSSSSSSSSTQRHLSYMLQASRQAGHNAKASMIA